MTTKMSQRMTLHEQLEHVEAVCRRLAIGTALAASFFLVLIGLAAEAGRQPMAKDVTATALCLVDAEGVVQGIFAYYEGQTTGPLLAVLDTEGNGGVRFGVNAKAGAARFAIRGFRQRPTPREDADS